MNAVKSPKSPKQAPPMTDAQRAIAERWLPLTYKLAGQVIARARKLGQCADAEEVASAATLALCRAAVSYDPQRINPKTGKPYSPASPIGKAVWRAAADAVGVMPPLTTVEEFGEVAAPPEVPPAEADEDRRRLGRALARLDRRSRKVLVWWSKGVSGAEIGERLGVTRERARQLRHRALRLAREGAA